jgi:16S rRNA U516 pseudouridylate synthase RsuA-like enzyme
MFEQLDHPVLELVRLRFGPLALGSLGPGELRPATEREVRGLRAILAAVS